MANTKTSALTALAGASIAAAADFIPIVDTSATTLKKVTPQALALALKTEVHVAEYATGGTGTSGDPWTGWDTAITWATFTRYCFKAGYYSYTTSPNFAYYGIEIVGEPGTYFYHVGTGNAFIMDAGGTGTFTVPDHTNDTCTLTSTQGLRDGLPVTVSNSGGALPTGLSAATTYYCRDVSGLDFKLAATLGGAAINITSTGTGTQTILSGQWYQNMRVENISILGKTTQLTGLLSLTSGGTAVTGASTLFLTEVAVGDAITFGAGGSTARSYVVSSITNDTSLTINRNATSTETSTTARVCKSTNGFFLRGLRNSTFSRCSVKDVVGAAIYTEACVTNHLSDFRCTYHEPASSTWFQCRPQYGMRFTGRGAADFTTCWQIDEPVIEGMQIYGIWLTSLTYGNTIINGTSEGNPGVGIQIDGTKNTIITTDVESNTGGDIVITASINALIGVNSFGTTTLSGSASNNSLLGGYYQALTLGGSTTRNVMLGNFVNGTLTDTGSGNYYVTKSATDLRSRTGINQPVVTGNSTGAANAYLTNFIEVTLSGDITVPAPTNPIDGLSLTYRFDNNSGSGRTLAWNAVFLSLTGATLPTTVANGTSVYVTVFYSSYWSKWQCINVAGS